MFEVIREIIEGCIGTPRRDGDGWLEYDCPYCAQEKGVESDGKYNLAVNYGEDIKTKPFFHCWRCGTSGKLSKLLKDFGTQDSLSRYYDELKNIKSSLLYRIDFGGELDDFQIENNKLVITGTDFDFVELTQTSGAMIYVLNHGDKYALF